MSFVPVGRDTSSKTARAARGRHPASAVVVGLVAALTVPIACWSQPASAAGIPTYYSTSDSGYVVYSTSAPPEKVSTQFRVPTVSDCTSKDRQIAIGPLVQDGSGEGAGPFVNVGCHAGEPEYEAGVNMFGTLTMFNAPIRPGDLISLTSTMISTSTKSTVNDKTTGFLQSVLGVGHTAAYGSITAGPVHEPPLTGTLLGVPEFTKVTLSKATVNDIDLGTFTATSGLYDFIRTTNGAAPPIGRVQVQLGALGKATFSLAFRHH